MYAMRIEILIFDGVDELDAFGPYEVLGEAGFDVALVTHPAADRIVTAHGAIVVPHRELSDRPELLVVPGGGYTRRPPKGAWAEVQRGVLPSVIAQRHAAGARIASVCTGAFLVAAAGLLEGRQAITHWKDVDELEALGIRVIRGARVQDDGDIITSGGVTSGLDLALWIVEQEQGREAADEIAAEIEHPRDARRVQAGGVRP
jgi:transcriptional regulator GlxA family with amidase domain